MQESLISGDGGRLSLSGTLSEWLFASKFWSEFNAQHGTMFDQFEEDEVDASMVGVIAESLDKKICAFRKQSECNVEFVYRWTSEHKPIIESVSRESLLSELTTFHEFLVAMAAKNCSVTFSL
jgi:hypothetical protein